jgi:hypothetical protein
MRLNRRQFTGFLGASLLAPRLAGQTARPNVGAIERERMIRLGTEALNESVTAIVTMPSTGSPGGKQDYFSTETFTAHRNALRLMCVRVAALAGAYGITRDDKFAEAAAVALRVWFVDEKTRMTPHLRFARVMPDAKTTGTPEGIIEGVYLAEVAVGMAFLAASPALTDADLAGVKAWFTAYMKWLTEPEDSGPRIAGLARDLHNHHGSSWILQATAAARCIKDDVALADLRHRFERATIRAQMVALGNFPAELLTPNPYRNSLFNLDMLAGACELLSTSFESVWDYELQDGPGMRAALAYHFQYIVSRPKWPYPADASHFLDLPLRRPALIFAARAYTRPEYADLWKTLPADPPEALAESFPIRQPYLWITRPPFRLVG